MRQAYLDQARLMLHILPQVAAEDWFSMDARAQDVTRCLSNLHASERDVLGRTPSEIKLPDSMRDGWVQSPLSARQALPGIFLQDKMP